MGFAGYCVTVALFALLFFAQGPACLELANASKPFGFGACYWFSLHTFTTIGESECVLYLVLLVIVLYRIFSPSHQPLSS